MPPANEVKSISKSHPLPVFDRSFLAPAAFEFALVADTHYILDPEPYAVEFNSVRQWPQRAAWAIQTAAALEAEFVIHLGDLTEENSARPQQAESRRRALAQFEHAGMRPYHVAGNMDIGDKPDPTMWTEWVTPQSLDTFHEQFGRSWYSFDRHGIHFVVLNSQIMNGPLPEAAEQQAWLEADLAERADRRIFLFMHMPPFFVQEQEADTGFYNSINEPARSWLTALLRQYRVELLFAGHTHFRVFNRVGDTRFYVAPSTTTSRAGFYEAFSVAPPPEQGRNDTAKVGLYLVRVCDDGARIHFVRTHGQTGPLETDRQGHRLLFRPSRDLPQSPVGVYLRTPLAHQSEGALAWPSVLRQRVRDDHPFLSIVEAGLRHVRAPLSDLDDEVQCRRLQLLRREGVALTAVWLWSDRLDLADSVAVHADKFDVVELQVPGALIPDRDCLQSLVQCREVSAKPIVLTPVIAREPAPDKYHPRTRFGYRPEELAALDRRLAELEIRLDRVLCHIDPQTAPWDAIRALRQYPPLSCIDGFDCLVGLVGVDDRLQAQRAAEALLAATLQPDCRLFLDPLVDLDRTNDINHGLLDRLSNPRPAYYAVQCLNTVLFGAPDTYAPLEGQSAAPDRILAIAGTQRRHWLILPQESGFAPVQLDGLDAESEVSVIDVTRGTRQTCRDVEHLKQILAGINTPYLLSQ